VRAIEVRGVSYTYRDGTTALRGLNLDVERGEKVGIVGPNGAGKSTLFELLTGLRFPDEGTIRIMGEELHRRNADDLRRYVGLVFQDPDDQVFMPRVWDDVAFGPINMNLPSAVVAERVQSALHAVGLEGFDDRVPHRLSQGERKRVAIAGVLAMDPEILLLDEPTADLDGAGRRRLIDDLNALEKTILVATHDVEAAVEITERAIVMDHSNLGGGSYEEIFSNPALLEGARLEVPSLPRLFSALCQEGLLCQIPTDVDEALVLLRTILPKKRH